MRAPWPSVAGLGAACWVVANVLGYALVSSGTYAPLYGRFVEKHLIGDLVFLGAAMVAAGIFLVLLRRLRLPRMVLYAAALFATSLDLWYFHVQYFQLEPRPAARIPVELLAIRPPIRFIEDANTNSSPLLHYSQFIHAAIDSRRVTLGTNEGGVQPASLERVYRAIERNRQVAARLTACDHEYLKDTQRWRKRADALPRIWLCHRDAAALCATPIDGVPAEQLAGAVDESVQIEIMSEQPRRLWVRVRCSKPGTLVFADLFYPGWRCRVNRVETAIERAFGVFRAVQLEAGESSVVLSFEPDSFRIGTQATLLGLVLLGLLFCGKRSGDVPCNPYAPARDRSLGVYAILLLALIPVEVIVMNHFGNRQVADLVMTPIGSRIAQTAGAK